MHRRRSRQQRKFGIRNAALRVQIVEGQHGVIPEIDRRSVFELNLCAPHARRHAEACLHRQVTDSRLPACASGSLGFLASRDAHIALNIANPRNLRKDRSRDRRDGCGWFSFRSGAWSSIGSSCSHPIRRRNNRETTAENQEWENRESEMPAASDAHGKPPLGSNSRREASCFRQKRGMCCSLQEHDTLAEIEQSKESGLSRTMPA